MKRLRLNRTTIRLLAGHQIKGAVGGYIPDNTTAATRGDTDCQSEATGCHSGLSGCGSCAWRR